MFSLIKKDILLQKRALLFAIAYGMFLIVAFNKNANFYQTIYVLGSGVISYIIIFGATGHDDKSKSAIIFNSLPIKRKNIVISKYLSVFVCALIGLSIMGILGVIIKIFGLPFLIRYIAIADVVATLVYVGFLNSIYLPLFYKFGNNSARIVNVIMSMIAFTIPNTLLKLYNEYRNDALVQKLSSIITSMTTWQIEILALVMLLAIVLISLLISIKIYNNKEF